MSRRRIVSPTLFLLALLALPLQALGEAPGFVASSGLTDPEVRFVSPGDTWIYLTDTSVVLDFRKLSDNSILGHALHFDFVGSTPNTQVELQGATGVRFSSFRGNDASRWIGGREAHSAVTYRDLWPGVDLTLTWRPDGLDYSIKADAKAQATFQLSVRGATSESKTGSRTILTTSVSREVHWTANPSGGTISWRDPAVPSSSKSSPFWSTLVGGSSNEDGGRPQFAANGDVIVAGATVSGNFPATAGAYDISNDSPGLWDSTLFRLSPDGSTLLWATYVGGVGNDQAQKALLDPSGSIWLYGAGISGQWPTTPGAFDRVPNGGYDGTIARISSDGSTLEFGTYLGGSSTEFLVGLAFDASGNLVCAGSTASSNFPGTAGGYQASFQGSEDAFVALLSADGSSLIQATYLGGSDLDPVYQVVVLDSGDIVVGGHTYSSDYPVSAGAFQLSLAGTTDGALTSLSSDLTSMNWSTYFGGDQTEAFQRLLLAPDGHILTTGETVSTDLATTPGAYQAASGGMMDGFAARFDPSTGQPEWTTYVGGTDTDRFWDAALLGPGYLVLAGTSRSTDFPVSGDALYPTNGGDWDAVLAVLSPSGTTLSYGSYLGGSARETALGVDVNSDQCVVIGGDTASSDYPTTAGAYDETFGGVTDNFIASWQLDIDFEEPSITCVDDVPNDQGLQVRLCLAASSRDDGTHPNPVLSYDVFRRFDNLPGKDYPPGDWDYVTSVPASGEAIYYVVVPTLCDCAMGGSECETEFFVRARTGNPFVSFDSLPMAGCSTDDIVPPAPAVQVNGSVLSWSPVNAPDVAWYNVYRLPYPYDPQDAEFVTSTQALSYDSGTMYEVLYVTAVDDAGNESPPSLSDATSIPDLATSARLYQNQPNPFNPSTVITFSLGAAADVELTVFDSSGRLVRTLLAGQVRAPGEHRVQWNGRDDHGRRVGSGAYYYRLDTGNAQETRKMVLLK